MNLASNSTLLNILTAASPTGAQTPAAGDDPTTGSEDFAALLLACLPRPLAGVSEVSMEASAAGAQGRQDVPGLVTAVGQADEPARTSVWRGLPRVGVTGPRAELAYFPARVAAIMAALAPGAASFSAGLSPVSSAQASAAANPGPALPSLGSVVTRADQNARWGKPTTAADRPSAARLPFEWPARHISHEAPAITVAAGAQAPPSSLPQLDLPAPLAAPQEGATPLIVDSSVSTPIRAPRTDPTSPDAAVWQDRPGAEPSAIASQHPPQGRLGAFPSSDGLTPETAAQPPTLAGSVGQSWVRNVFALRAHRLPVPPSLQEPRPAVPRPQGDTPFTARPASGESARQGLQAAPPAVSSPGARIAQFAADRTLAATYQPVAWPHHAASVRPRTQNAPAPSTPGGQPASTWQGSPDAMRPGPAMVGAPPEALGDGSPLSTAAESHDLQTARARWASGRLPPAGPLPDASAPRMQAASLGEHPDRAATSVQPAAAPGPAAQRGEARSEAGGPRKAATSWRHNQLVPTPIPAAEARPGGNAADEPITSVLGAHATPWPAGATELPVRVEAVRAPQIEAASLPARGEVRHLRLEIEPPQLGGCELELTVHEQALHAVVIADRPETVAALRGAEPQVRQALADQGIEVAGFEVRQGADGSLGHAPRQPDLPASPADPLSAPVIAGDDDPVVLTARLARRVRASYVDLLA